MKKIEKFIIKDIHNILNNYVKTINYDMEINKIGQNNKNSKKTNRFGSKIIGDYVYGQISYYKTNDKGEKMITKSETFDSLSDPKINGGKK